ncbi:hypothetical protein GCM10011399_32030 [Subtercola lobariae]|uniref:Uncharacterized protein n=1 Tax=Subtercola lobariae TaxID=1588641 RepID=A0A917BEY7_9MICO|nr:hypothetical protein GCM10011399_32030 [Subtercola lobariae]
MVAGVVVAVLLPLLVSGVPVWIPAVVTANGINNLPAYLVLEPAAAGSSVRLAALPIGASGRR